MAPAFGLIVWTTFCLLLAIGIIFLIVRYIGKKSNQIKKNEHSESAGDTAIKEEKNIYQNNNHKDAKGANFKNKDGKIVVYQNAVVPLISSDLELGKMFFIGTAFYISAGGLLMTAKHCLYDKDEEMFNNLGVIHFLPDNQYILRPIRKGAFSENLDIAYLLPEQILHKGEPYWGSYLTLSSFTPQYNEQLSMYGFPRSRITYFDDETGTADFRSEFYLGKCREYHDSGFGLLKNSCYQTNIKIMSGASGGPVFDKDGYVFAVSSTGYDFIDGGEDVSFVTPIAPSLSIEIEDDSGNKFSINELITKGIVSVKE